MRAATRPAQPRGRVQTARPDIRALVAGVAVLGLGGLILAHAIDLIDLSFALFAPVACAATGAILLANGLARGQ